MTTDNAGLLRETVETIYRNESRRVLATLIRLLRDFELAEEALHDAFIVAVEQWQQDGIPDNPRAWLVSAGRFKAIDKIRRRAHFDKSLNELAEQLDETVEDPEIQDLEDDRLRLDQQKVFNALAAGREGHSATGGRLLGCKVWYAC